MTKSTDISTYKTLGMLKIIPTQYSPRLVITAKDFYNTVIKAIGMTKPEMLVSGRYLSPSSAAEEEAIYEKASYDEDNLRHVKELRDYFGYTDKHPPVSIWTTTGLRFREADLRKPYNVGVKVTAQVIETDIMPFLSQIADPKFTRDNWKDIIDKVNQVVGEVTIPYARGHVIREMHHLYGIFTEVEPTEEHTAPFALHGRLAHALDIPPDPISGHYDVAVMRRDDHHHEQRCLSVDAYRERWHAYSNADFRPVIRGYTNVDIEKVR